MNTGRWLTFIGTGRGSSGPTDVRTIPVTLSKYDFPGETYMVKTLTPPFRRAHHGDSGGPVFATEPTRNVVIAVLNGHQWQIEGGQYVAMNTI